MLGCAMFNSLVKKSVNKYDNLLKKKKAAADVEIHTIDLSQ